MYLQSANHSYSTKKNHPKWTRNPAYEGLQQQAQGKKPADLHGDFIFSFRWSWTQSWASSFTADISFEESLTSSMLFVPFSFLFHWVKFLKSDAFSYNDSESRTDREKPVVTMEGKDLFAGHHSFKPHWGGQGRKQLHDQPWVWNPRVFILWPLLDHLLGASCHAQCQVLGAFDRKQAKQRRLQMLIITRNLTWRIVCNPKSLNP